MRDSLRGDAPSAYPRECDTLAGSQGGSARRPARGRGQDVDLPTGHRRYAARPVAIYANHQTFGVEILCGLILLSYFEVVVGII